MSLPTGRFMSFRRTMWALAILALLCGSGIVTAGPARAECAVDDGLTALGLVSTTGTSSDGFTYAKWSGLIPSWDGVPLSVNVTVAQDAPCALPLMSINHGWGATKTSVESSTVEGSGFGYHWNNLWFASRGYAALTFTARGFADSCGKASSSDGTAAGLPQACTASGRHYWIQFNDARYSLRDLQWLIGRLVDAGVADAGRIAVSGGSMGGGLSWLAAVANDRVMCGGVAWDPANGNDPCAGAKMGSLVPWTSPAGVPLRIAAAVPMYGYASLLHVLLPNGRASDAAPGAPAPGDHRIPIGIPVKTWISSLNALGSAIGFYKPSTSSDKTSDWGVWFADLGTQINTSTIKTSASAKRINNTASVQWRDYKSPLSGYLPVDAKVPILALHGTTDAIIGPLEAHMMWQKLTAYSTDYPISIIFGDAGHAPAANPADFFAYANDRANDFVEYFLRGLGSSPTFGAHAALSRCRSGTASDPLEILTASTPVGLATGGIDISSTTVRSTTNTGGGAESAFLGPVGIPACATMTKTTDAGVAAWTWPLGQTLVLSGQPWVTLTLRTTASDAQLNTRLWLLTPDGKQTLISRGTYRLAIAPSSSDTTVSYEIPANFFRLPVGDKLKLEVTGYDAPHFQANTIASTTTITSVKLHLPT